ncbi:hypothetical protein CEXT_430221 [Caerostris extrusa]|uniref:Maturase K n=1 Tax=Caerostris extrusa TaxID=172846 RepID=A0AAV4XX52_CAEEX|nr:hypothetical protein CEXT_430221 [Caerostris extrusa]
MYRFEIASILQPLRSLFRVMAFSRTMEIEMSKFIDNFSKELLVFSGSSDVLLTCPLNRLARFGGWNRSRLYFVCLEEEDFSLGVSCSVRPWKNGVRVLSPIRFQGGRSSFATNLEKKGLPQRILSESSLISKSNEGQILLAWRFSHFRIANPPPTHESLAIHPFPSTPLLNFSLLCWCSFSKTFGIGIILFIPLKHCLIGSQRHSQSPALTALYLSQLVRVDDIRGNENGTSEGGIRRGFLWRPRLGKCVVRLDGLERNECSPPPVPQRFFCMTGIRTADALNQPWSVDSEQLEDCVTL